MTREEVLQRLENKIKFNDEMCSFIKGVPPVFWTDEHEFLLYIQDLMLHEGKWKDRYDWLASHNDPPDKSREIKIIKDLKEACVTLMDELVGKKATRWGIVNDALVAADKYLLEEGN